MCCTVFKAQLAGSREGHLLCAPNISCPDSFGLPLPPPQPIPLKPRLPPKEPQQGGGQRGTDLIHSSFHWPDQGLPGPRGQHRAISLRACPRPRQMGVLAARESPAPLAASSSVLSTPAKVCPAPLTQSQAHASETSIGFHLTLQQHRPGNST